MAELGDECPFHISMGTPGNDSKVVCVIPRVMVHSAYDGLSGKSTNFRACDDRVLKCLVFLHHLPCHAEPILPKFDQIPTRAHAPCP